MALVVARGSFWLAQPFARVRSLSLCCGADSAKQIFLRDLDKKISFRELRKNLDQRSLDLLAQRLLQRSCQRDLAHSSNLDKRNLEKLPWYLFVMFLATLFGVSFWDNYLFLETNITKHARGTSRALPTTSGPPCKPRPKGVMKSHITTPRTVLPVALSMLLAKRYPLFPPYDSVNTTNLSTRQHRATEGSNDGKGGNADFDADPV